MKARVALFYHSLVSDWNHGNAHFLRGIASELIARGHEVRIFEPEDGWSRENLLRERGEQAVRAFETAFPELVSTRYRIRRLALDEWLDGVDLVIVHEWNNPTLIAAVGSHRKRRTGLRAFFHDTHHRALTSQDEMARFPLADYDGVLAYGASLKDRYHRLGWGQQVHVWHEAADTRIFYPRESASKVGDVIWIGNWGDEERTEELSDYFIRPVKRSRLRAQVYGVRYPDSALHQLNDAGISYGGWLPNFEVPPAFARFHATVHVPRRPYTRELPGIPTIRPFEALACGIPMVSAPWRDTEGLFRMGEDFLMAESGQEMEKHLRDLLVDTDLACSIAKNGLETIRRRHTCAHRVDELLTIFNGIRPSINEPATAGVEA